MKIAAEDYASMKAFFGWMLDNAIPLPIPLAPEHHPLVVLDTFEKRSPAKARQGLAMAIGDILELAPVDPVEIRRIDDGLRWSGLPTLSEVRVRFWKKIQTVLKRGRVLNEGEYHVLRNVVDAMPEDEADKVWAILADFEMSIAKAGAR